MRGVGTDIDMANCHPVLLRYICHKHNIPCPNLEYYINNRDSCLALYPSRNKGKTAFLVSTNSDKTSRAPNAPLCFKLYDKEMKQIQKTLLSIPEYNELRETIPEYKLTKNYNGSAINRVLCYYENIVLQHAIHIINTYGLEVAILMFDGLMVYGDHYENTQLLVDIEKYVEEKMPTLNMKWTYKEHDDTLEIPEDFNEADGDDVIVANTDNEACLLLYQYFKDKIIVVKRRIFMKKNNIWMDNFEEINEYILKHTMNSNIYCRKGEDIKPFVQNINSAKNVRETLINKLKTEDELKNNYEKFHNTTKHRLAFLDGVLDFKTKQFYKWDEITFEYYSTVQIKRNFHQILPIQTKP